VGCALKALSRVPDGQAEIFACADNFHGRTRGITGFSTDAAAREHFGPFTLARAMEEEGITTSFGNNWQAIDIAKELFDHFFQMRLEIII
jgi:acetylornithine/succinyldiaminopimelate/putrescine aminotransferase